MGSNNNNDDDGVDDDNVVDVDVDVDVDINAISIASEKACGMITSHGGVLRHWASMILMLTLSSNYIIYRLLLYTLSAPPLRSTHTLTIPQHSHSVA